MNGHNFIKPLIGQFLRGQLGDDVIAPWTVQGFGMLRTYFGPPSDAKRFRLNLWDDRLAVKNVSTVHDHPWDFESMIVAGTFVNQRFILLPREEYSTPTHHFTTIRTGEGGGPVRDEQQNACLRRGMPEVYREGAVYSQRRDEVHESIPVRGTVTINERTAVEGESLARVFWPLGTSWVDAEPRQAAWDEIRDGIKSALEWF